MTRNPIELLVLYQDLDLMLKETADAEATMGFEMEGREKLRKAMDDIAKNISPRFLRTYQRLHTRFKRPIVPVQNDVCLERRLPRMLRQTPHVLWGKGPQGPDDLHL
jgi:hypothetical protein